MEARGDRDEQPEEPGPSEGQTDGTRRDPSRSSPDRADRVEQDPGTPLVGGESHWTPASVGGDPTSQTLLAMARWFPIGRWAKRRRARGGDDGPSGSEG